MASIVNSSRRSRSRTCNETHGEAYKHTSKVKRATMQIPLAPTRQASLERGPDATTYAKELETHTSLDCFERKCRKKIDYRSVARVKPQV